MSLYRHTTACRLLSFIHHVLGKDIYSRDVPLLPTSQFLIKDRYARSIKFSIEFSRGSVTVSISTAQILIEIRKINFKVLYTPKPFLLCLTDMDRLKVYCNNTIDKLVQGNVRIPVIRI
ncbi:hypothetical protein BU23DRAFT_582167 [Bimuria novae-zelandiae CBS 107.79]|uniref:Uncharacterized protein n=1 Tax=Bimuria novae-zelandiae CBS 107.79 TaxID=1447943 RepID=A0A6A5V067_9PLEO|nr:hypothetical protein BU23DRAFT_582167 [Bimuria novae-zelandiae CBS 107.79]